MFQRRRYKRGKSERKRIPRVRKKPYRNKKQLPQTTTAQSTVSKLYTNDISYIDQAVTTSYSWTTLVNPTSSKDTRRRKIPSLAHLCSVELANHASMLSQTQLEAAPWSIWKRVWQEILRVGRDSILIYREFNSVFGTEPDFKSNVSSSSSNDKDTMIDMYRIPHALRHRIDTIFANVHLGDVVAFLNSFKYVPYVMLDLSMLKLNNEVLFSIFHIQKLMCIDLSNSNIDDSYLIQLANSITAGKLQNLTIIKINKCPLVTKLGVQSLLNLKKCCLACIETDICLPITRHTEDNQGYVNNSNWIRFDANIMPTSLIFKLPLALKLHTLIRFYGDLIITKPEASGSIIKDLLRELRQSNIFDLLISSENYSTDVGRLWEERIHAKNRVYYSGCIYIIDNNYQELASPFPLPTQEIAIKKEEQEIEPPQTTQHKTGRIRKRTIKADAKSFFCI
ncbi:hypothetical protein JA1_003243 [Spathaspora sp. JA1]|nr:hypothetical protein JA1_003243 [Spathaspora sp. JA1]